MGILLCEQNFRDVWRRKKSVRAEIGQIVRTHTHAAQLVVEIYNSYSIIGRSLVNLCKGLEPRKYRSMRGVGLFFAKSRSLSDNMGQLCIALGTLHIVRCSPRKPNNFIQTRQ